MGTHTGTHRKQDSSQAVSFYHSLPIFPFGKKKKNLTKNSTSQRLFFHSDVSNESEMDNQKHNSTPSLSQEVVSALVNSVLKKQKIHSSTPINNKNSSESESDKEMEAGSSKSKTGSGKSINQI